MNNYSKIILIFIILLAAFLRFNQLNSLPALNADEAAIGYNVYSLLQTGFDEHGNSWPIHFQSFNDYKPGLFFYIVLPFVWLMGLTELAVRIPGALLGVGTVLLVYLLVKELFGSAGPASRHKSTQLLALLSAFFLAISPWHIHFSRGGWEVNAGTFFIILGLWAFLKGLSADRQALKERKWFLFSVITFVASLYTYHAARIIVPLILVGLLLFYRKALLSKLKYISLVAVFGLVLLFPLIRDFTGSAGISRASGVGLLADSGPVSRAQEQRGEHGNFQSFPAVALHNKPINYGLAYLENWFEHYWGEFLFLSGDAIQRNKVSETGVLYLFDLPLIIIGLIAIIRMRTASWRIIIWWLIVAPIAAALTFQSPHALRAHNMIIPLVIISAYGGTTLWDWTKKMITNKRLLTIGLLGYWVVGLFFFTRYLHQYYVHMAKDYPFSSQYGVKELVSYVSDNYDKYPVFAITDRYDQPYILFLFYSQYSPQKFQQDHRLTPRDKFGFSTVRDFDKFHFEEIFDWGEISEKFRGGLIIGTDEETPDGRNIVHTIYFPNGDPVFRIVAN